MVSGMQDLSLSNDEEEKKCMTVCHIKLVIWTDRNPGRPVGDDRKKRQISLRSNLERCVLVKI